MIVRSTDILSKFISVNSSLKHETLSPYLQRAERKHIIPLIGKAQYAIFDVESEPTDTVIKEAYNLAAEASSNFGVYYALPILRAQVSEGGIFNAQSDLAKIATDKDFKELQRSFKSAAHEALDEMFKVMESDLTKFSAWTSDDSYKDYTSLLVNSTSVFQKYYNINNSRQTFLALVPEIKVVEPQFIEAPIGKELLKALKEVQTSEKRKEAKSLLQQSIVSFTLAKVLTNGLFRLDPDGIHVRFDVLPYEKIHANQNISEFISESRKNKASEGEQFLKKALKIVQDNPSDFSEYTAPVESDNTDTITHNTKSITLL